MYPCIHDIQVSMISKYPIIQVSKKNRYPRYPCIRIHEKSGIRPSLIRRPTLAEMHKRLIINPTFFQIHWFSIFNSFMMVIFLVGLVSMILMRTLRKDYARYSKEDDVDDMERDLGKNLLVFPF